MGPQLYWTYAFNILVNSVLSFFTTLLLIEFFLFIFRIKHPRMKVLCRALPFCKLCLDPLLYQFSNWSLSHGMNPMLAEIGTRKLSGMFNPFAGIQFSLEDGKTFSVADLIALTVNPLWIQGIVCIVIVGAAATIILHGIRTIYEKQKIAQMIWDSRPYALKSGNPSLVAWMKKKRVSLAISNEVFSPCLLGKTILFPASLVEDFTNEEFDAVIAHELAHCHWKDSALRLFCSFVAALFWWVPSRWLQRGIEEMQEQASDRIIHRFGITPLALATAVLKTAQQTKEKPSLLSISFAGDRLLLKNRMCQILQEPTKCSLGWRVMQYGLLISFMLFVLFGKLWIF